MVCSALGVVSAPSNLWVLTTYNRCNHPGHTRSAASRKPCSDVCITSCSSSCRLVPNCVRVPTEERPLSRGAHPQNPRGIRGTARFLLPSFELVLQLGMERLRDSARVDEECSTCHSFSICSVLLTMGLFIKTNTSYTLYPLSSGQILHTYSTSVTYVSASGNEAMTIGYLPSCEGDRLGNSA